MHLTSAFNKAYAWRRLNYNVLYPFEMWPLWRIRLGNKCTGTKTRFRSVCSMSTTVKAQRKRPSRILPIIGASISALLSRRGDPDDVYSNHHLLCEISGWTSRQSNSRQLSLARHELLTPLVSFTMPDSRSTALRVSCHMFGF